MKMVMSKYLMILMCMMLAPAWAQETNKKPTETKKKLLDVRVIEIDGFYHDHPMQRAPSMTDMVMGGGVKYKSFMKLSNKLEEIASGKKFGAVYFNLSETFGLNRAQAEQLTRRIESLKAAHIKTVAWVKYPSILQYAVAASCDKVIMSKSGDMDFASPAMSVLYMKDAMDFFGVKVDTLRVGDFKGAIEPFMQSSMSAHLKAHYKSMITSINDNLLAPIVKNRGVEKATLRKLQAKRFVSPEEALKSQLVDELVAFGDEASTVEDLLGGHVAWSYPVAPERKKIGFFDLMNILLGNNEDETNMKEAVAVLHLNGAISDGSRRGQGIVSGPTVRVIDELRVDDFIKGVVVRINSPGGSASASEEIRVALEKLAKKKKVIISMGSMAASGGYWISCLNRPIYAEPSTVTGSIGVFGMKMSFGPLMKRLGVKVETVELDESSSMMSMGRGLTEAEKKNMQKYIDRTYQNFITLVSTSRKMKPEDAKKLAGGRIFTGAQALKNGLVDKLGGLDVALSDLKQSLKLPANYHVMHFPESDLKGLNQLQNIMNGDHDYVKVSDKKLAFKLLHKAGFDFSLYKLLIEQSLTHNRPQSMALCPSQFVIR